MDWKPEIPPNHVIAGAVGSLMSLRYFHGDTWGKRMFNALSGFLGSLFLTAPIAEWMTIVGPAKVGALGFLIGMFGIALADAIAAFVRALTKEDILALWPWKKKEGQ